MTANTGKRNVLASPVRWTLGILAWMDSSILVANFANFDIRTVLVCTVPCASICLLLSWLCCVLSVGELLVDKAMALDHIGGVYGGNVKPTPFLCLILKMLQIQPHKDIVIEFIKNPEYKWELSSWIDFLLSCRNWKRCDLPTLCHCYTSARSLYVSTVCQWTLSKMVTV